MLDDLDQLALQGFIDETNESLQGIETAFIDLEKDPGNMEIINRIFRPVHSMKGNSGFFGLTHINKFAHRLEDLLDFIRKGEIVASHEVIDILLTGVEYLQGMLDQVEDGSSTNTLTEEEEKFLTEKVETCRPSVETGSLQSVFEFEELLKDAQEAGIDFEQDSFVKNALGQVATFNKELKELIVQNDSKHTPIPAGLTYSRQNSDYSDILSPLVNTANQLSQGTVLTGEDAKVFKDSTAKVKLVLEGELGLEQTFDELETLANFVDDEFMATSKEFANSIYELISILLGFFEAVEDSSEQKLGDILVEQEAITPDQLNKALDKQIISKHRQKKAKPQNKTIRINQDKLDDFVDAVGELFINVDSFNFLTKKIENSNLAPDVVVKYHNNLSALDNMLAKLQADVMSIRKVPVNSLFQRFPKVIRKLSGSLNKDIDFRLTGEQTVIDKDLIETIENPLVHILRNSLDHGIETPEIREQKNKAGQGVLELKASVDENNVYLVIADDGAGIDPQKMKEIAVKKGFLSSEEVEYLDDDELVNLIFKPGFSSAEQVSDVSGRGVGMDAVMAGLDQCNGKINVSSVLEQGTTVTITIPLTRSLVTKDALVVEISEQLFAIPSDIVTTTIFPHECQVDLLGGQSGLSYNGKVLKLIDSGDFFYDSSGNSDKDVADRVIIICEKFEAAVLVDQVYNHQQIVVKLFKDGYKQFRNIPGIYGYTILGNEDVVLIVDVEDMVQDSIVNY